MPSLTYPSADFTPFTKILSSDVNGKFTAIKTLLNTTKLDYQNLQLQAIMGATQTSLQIVGTSAAGTMTTQAYVLASQGGMGFSYTATTTDIGKVLQVNTSGTALTMEAVPSGPGLLIYNFYRFG